MHPAYTNNVSIHLCPPDEFNSGHSHFSFVFGVHCLLMEGASKCSTMFTNFVCLPFCCPSGSAQWVFRAFPGKQLPAVAENNSIRAVTVNQNSEAVGRKTKTNEKSARSNKYCLQSSKVASHVRGTMCSGHTRKVMRQISQL